MPLWQFYLWMMSNHLYIHIPFCQHICAYCDFCRIGYSKKMADDYLPVLFKEINDLGINNFDTVYLGGGTPSALSIEQLNQLFSFLKKYIKEDTEYTMEVNPETVDEEKVKVIRGGGINRVSLGVQVTQENLLKTIFRKHTYNDVKSVIGLFNNVGITNITIDLMYGIPGQTLADFEESIDEITKLPIKHISLYSLTIEPNSYFGKRGIKALDEETDATMYYEAIRLLSNKGFTHYEISNFALDENYYSRHNMSYWNYNDFYGVGVSASSKVGNKRYTNTFSLRTYINEYIDKREVINLSDEDVKFEYTMMNLRLKKGLDLNQYKQLFNEDFD